MAKKKDDEPQDPKPIDESPASEPAREEDGKVPMAGGHERHVADKR